MFYLTTAIKIRAERNKQYQPYINKIITNSTDGKYDKDFQPYLYNHNIDYKRNFDKEKIIKTMGSG